MTDFEWCYTHNPDLEETRRRNNRKGGKRGGRGRPLADTSRIQARLEQLAEMVVDGELETSRGSVAGQLYNTALRSISTAQSIIENQELKAELEELRELLEEGGYAQGAG